MELMSIRIGKNDQGLDLNKKENEQMKVEVQPIQYERHIVLSSDENKLLELLAIDLDTYFGDYCGD